MLNSRNGRIVLAVFVALAIPVGAVAWWLGSPLFLDKTVEEEFPLAASAQIEGMTLTRLEVEELTQGAPAPDVETIIERMTADVAAPTNQTALAVTRADAEAIMDARDEVEEPVAEEMPQDDRGGAVALLRGEFHDIDGVHRGSGTATVYALADGSQLLRLEKFNGTNGPDLRVLLSVHPDPDSQSQLKGQGYVELAKLKGNIGNQNYEVPADIDAAGYRSVVIYCRPFHVLFTVAPLSEA